MALTDFLTSIADAIRTKDGTTNPIVANAFPQRILDLAVGGGVNITGGTFTPATNMPTMEVEHGMNAVPNVSIVIALEDAFPNTAYTIFQQTSSTYKIQQCYGIYSNWGNIYGYGSKTVACDTYDETKITFNAVPAYSKAELFFLAGIRYYWFALRLEE